MAKINIEVNNKNLPTVLNILENIKIGLIKNISIEKLPKINKAVSSSISNKKYLSKDKYKQKLNQKSQEDEFLSKTPSTSKYMSKEEFKNKSRKGQ